MTAQLEAGARVLVPTIRVATGKPGAPLPGVVVDSRLTRHSQRFVSVEVDMPGGRPWIVEADRATVRPAPPTVQTATEENR